MSETLGLSFTYSGSLVRFRTPETISSTMVPPAEKGRPVLWKGIHRPFLPRPSAATRAASIKITTQTMVTSFARLGILPLRAMRSDRKVTSTSSRAIEEVIAARMTSR